jgi:hypothetical protein
VSALDDLAFRLRSTLTWSPPAFKRLASRAEVEAVLDVAGRDCLAALERRFDLSAWAGCCSLPEWRESLYVLDVLRTHLPANLPEGRGLDVGAKNGCTLPGLATASPRGWDAVELDAHRRYLWGSTRRVYGEALARRFPGCRFVAGSVADQPGPWAVATWFLPFLTAEPLAAWGLPARALEPERLLRHVLERLLPGGALLLVNQGREEAELQRQLLDEVGARARELGRVDSPLSPFRLERFGFLVAA